VPGWHAFTKEWREKGDLALVGIVQEQHPDRARLFAQWQGLDFPILWDPFNLTGSKVVPITLAVDEHGIVRAVNPEREKFEDEFLRVVFPPTAHSAAARVEIPGAIADLMAHDPAQLDAAVAALESAASRTPIDSIALFRAGVARRLRYDADGGNAADFQGSLDHWRGAWSLDPEQYIWRRRTQQYGPRMDKPYPFYDWVAEAQAQITARGETPVALGAQLTPSELAEKGRFVPGGDEEEPDALKKVPLDTEGWLAIESATAFDTSGQTPVASLHLVLQPNAKLDVHFDDEAGPVVVWLGSVDQPDGFEFEARHHQLRPAKTGRAAEERRLAVDTRLRAGSRGGKLRGYVLFYGCQGVEGTCRYLRHDFEVELRVP